MTNAFKGITSFLRNYLFKKIKYLKDKSIVIKELMCH